ncbi:MAG: V-type ATP synthase subunit D [Candidatus Omnitrophica bacterium]|nr:V-type ATP synthase subunit D [Candidatus Omnitrophota bacterium]
MAQIQYNKTALLKINKDLSMRENALPVLRSKESALRAETRKVRLKIRELDQKYQQMIKTLVPIERLWVEFPNIVKIDKINFKKKKIASLAVFIIEGIDFNTEVVSFFAYPSWVIQGVEIIKKLLFLKIELINEKKILDSVEYARRKTTQKVNLYQKVQIPFFEESIRKIKRFLEDQDNLSKSSQKVIKNRMEAALA